jgi:hypothetical protein
MSSSASNNSSRPLKVGAATLITVLLLAVTPARAAEVWIDVSKTSDRKIVLALPPLAAHEGP